MQLFVRCFDYSIGIECLEEEIIKKLHKEFFYFAEPQGASPDYNIAIRFQRPLELPELKAKKILENSIIYETNSEKFVQYSKSLVIQNKNESRATIYSQDQDEAYEISFLLIHSLLGKNLDYKGIHRVHAVGVSLNNTNALIMLPSKGGKSTLLSYLLNDPKIKIISDDMPIIDKEGRVHPFPSKISVQEIPTSGELAKLKWNKFERTLYPPKYTASLSQLNERINPSSDKNKSVLIAGVRISSSNGYLKKVPKIQMIAPLVEHMIFGFGLPQVLEYFLNFNFKDFFILPLIACKRMRAAFNLLRQSETYFLYLGSDKEKNAKNVINLLNEHH